MTGNDVAGAFGAADTAATSAGTDADRVYAVLARRHADFDRDDVLRALGGAATPETVDAALVVLVEAGRAVNLPNGRYLSDIAAQRLRDTARRTAADFHRRHPFRRSLPQQALHAPLQKAADLRSTPDAISWVVAEGVLALDDAERVRLPEHEVTLPPAWQDAGATIHAVYVAAEMRPPSPDGFQANYPRDIHVPTILEVLVDRGDLVTLAPGLHVSAQAMAAAKDAIRRLAASPTGITVGAVRDATGASRRILLPLLEYLDSQGFTRRVGDGRILA